MDLCFSTLHDVCRLEQRQPFEPKACRLGFPMSILPRLDHLIWLPDLGRYDADRVFQGNALDWGFQQIAHKLKRLFLLFNLVLELAGA